MIGQFRFHGSVLLPTYDETKRDEIRGNARPKIETRRQEIRENKTQSRVAVVVVPRKTHEGGSDGRRNDIATEDDEIVDSQLSAWRSRYH